MGYSVLRIEPRTVQGARAMLAHALREDRPPNAIPGAPLPQRLAGVETSDQGMAKVRKAIEDAKAAKRWQKSVKPVLDVLVTFSRDDLARLSPKEQDAYFAKALAFCTERFGGPDNVLSAVIHRDESTPHMQLLMLARHPGARLSATGYMGGRGDLSKLQTAFWTSCGQPFGMRRGEERMGARHLPVRQLYSALAAGAEVPELVDVPELGTFDQFSPTKRKAREAAIEKNIEVIEKTRAMAARQAGLHPNIIAAEAERYRKAKSEASLLEKQNALARQQLESSKELLAENTKKLNAVQKEYFAITRGREQELKQHQEKLNGILKQIDHFRAMRDRESGPSYGR